MPDSHQQHQPPKEHDKSDHPGVYQVRPDRNSSIIGAGVLAAFAWFAANWAGGVQDDAEEARITAIEAERINQQQTEILQMLPEQLDSMMQATITPLQQRLDDIRNRESDAYSRDAAARDRAEQEAAIQALRQEINANQSTISTTTGRVDSMEKSLSEVNRRLEQIYQAVISNNRTSADYMRPIYERDYHDFNF